MEVERRCRTLICISLSVAMECLLTSSLLAQVPARADIFCEPLPNGASLRLGSTRLRHPKGTQGITFSPDGKALATGGGSGDLILWNVADGKSIRKRRYYKDGQVAIQSLAFSADGRRLAFSAYPRGAVLIDVATGRELQRFNVDRKWEGWIRSLALTPDGQIMATLSLSPTGDGTEWVAEVWNCATGQLLYDYRFPGSDGIVQTLAFSPDGETLIAGGSTHPAILKWRAKKIVVEAVGIPDETVVSLTYCADGKSFVTGGYSHIDSRGMIRVCDAATGAPIRQMSKGGSRLAACSALALSADGKVLATRHADRLLIWDFPGNRMVREIELPSHSYQPNGLALSANGALAAMTDGHIWNTSDGSLLYKPAASHAGRVVNLQWSSDGKSLVSLCPGDSVRIWDTVSGRQTAIVGEVDSLTNHLLLSSDSQTLICVERLKGEQELLRFYDFSTQKLIGTISLEVPIMSSALSPDGRVLAVGSGASRPIGSSRVGSHPRVSLWNVSTRKHIADVPEHDQSIIRLKFSGDGKTLLSVTSDGVLRRWDTSKRALLKTGVQDFPAGLIQQQAPLWSVVFADDLSAVGVLSRGNNVLSILKLGTRLDHTIMMPNHSREPEVAFSPDAQTAVVSQEHSLEGTTDMQLIDTITGRVLHNFEGEYGSLCSVKFSSDGKRLAAGTEMGTILIFDLPAKLLKRGANKWATRSPIYPRK